VEVLYLSDPVDEFVMSALHTFEGHPLTSIDAADIDLPGTDPEVETRQDAPASGLGRVLTLFREALGDRVKDVRESKRLTDSPCCLVNTDGGLSTQMQRLLKMANQSVPATGRILEINPSSPLIRRLASLGANPDHDAFIRQCGLQLWSNALLLEGTLAEPEETVARSQTFMEEAADKRSPIVF
jgi:molecular chaperone HtpG